MSLAFVTGASRGLGREVARALIASGHEVIGISKDPQRAAQAGAELGIAFETVDFSDISQTRALSQTLLAKYGTPQILALAHGVMSDKMAKTLRTNDDEWARVMNINLNSVFTLVNAIGARWLKRETVASSSSLPVLVECQDQEMLGDLRLIESLKQE